ncbi:hypothetical protein KR222_000016, partial [Zaprionus bogoriensis]
SAKMAFKYLKDFSEGEFFRSRFSYKYLDVGMQYVGWLPPARNHRFYWLYMVYSAFIIFLMVLYLPIAFFSSYFIDFQSFTPGDFLTSVQVAFNAAGLGLKIIVVAPKMWRFEKAKEILDEMDKRCVTLDEQTEVHRTVVLCNSIFIFYQCIYTGYIIMTSLSSLITGSTPWGFYLPYVDYRNGVKDFWTAVVMELFVGSAAVYSDQMIDIIPLVFSFLLRTHLKLLIERVKRLRTVAGESDEESYEELVQCVKDHKLLLEYCDLYRPIISGTIFSQFLVIGVGLGLAMMNLLFFSTLWTGVATSIFIFVLMIETFPFCYLCELIDDDCNELTSCIFYSNWVTANKRYKSTIIFFVHQTQQSIKFIAGGIFQISIRTNIEVAKLAFSVVTIVKQMNIIEKLM